MAGLPSRAVRHQICRVRDNAPLRSDRVTPCATAGLVPPCNSPPKPGPGTENKIYCPRNSRLIAERERKRIVCALREGLARREDLERTLERIEAHPPDEA